MKKDLLYIVAQFLLFALYFIDIPLGNRLNLPQWVGYGLLALLISGGIIIVLGIVNMNDSLSPFPKPKTNGSLISHGIYYYVRHPIYIGIVISMVAYGGYTQSLVKILISLILLGVFYLKSDLEERYLLRKFEEYTQYKKKTGRFFPRFSSKV
ncbi:methyltransferase family protein [Altibacter sp. HG106]|uniref:methyltransferase family protein n=1 Tax=Altibacter sp. HG106 TaxID=3023937 RepID=UPI0023507E7C|nr:isoprenylcysteine carboxylmethyltransferase family protein [Altibacter sp. HG106]MDC7993855.1 isoprenylcysteine carboxylmethyltransferase family protein [Altibacter sp. HG106]